MPSTTNSIDQKSWNTLRGLPKPTLAVRGARGDGWTFKQVEEEGRESC
ncbi:MAG: hypothetical protein LBF22_07715 [Deltaproteobacteria bacterium]|nr:hypothetical protein [Deltaproteobacteria bacterium]